MKKLKGISGVRFLAVLFLSKTPTLCVVLLRARLRCQRKNDVSIGGDEHHMTQTDELENISIV